MPIDQLLTYNSDKVAQTIKQVETRQYRWQDESVCKDCNGHMTAWCHVYTMNSWQILAQREDYIVRIFLFLQLSKSCMASAHFILLDVTLSSVTSLCSYYAESFNHHLLNHFSKLHLKKNKYKHTILLQCLNCIIVFILLYFIPFYYLKKKSF